MQLRLSTLFFLFIVTGLSYTLTAQVKFTASIAPGTIGKDEMAELKLVVENAGRVEQILPPDLRNFNIISGPNQESGMEMVNGTTRQYIGISYLLKPKSTGNFTIGAAIARADGKDLKSNTAQIKVVKGTTGNRAGRSSPLFPLLPFEEPQEPAGYNDFILQKGENIEDKISKNLFVKVEADKTTCYIGEPVVVTYKLYTRLKSESNIIKNPSFNGFSVIDLVPSQSGFNYSVEKLNGRDYNVYILRKVQLYPLQAGVAELEVASVDNRVQFVKAEYLPKGATQDVFGDFVPGAIPREAMLDERVTVESKPMQIDVKPLPEADKPGNFNGAVGNYTVEAIVEKDSLTTDDAGMLKLLLSGEGNFTLLPTPEVTWPAGIEGYEPRVKEGLNKLSVPVSGSKIFDYPFTCSKEGVFTISPIVFSFFDVASGKYKTVSTQPLTVTVKKGTGKKPVLPAADPRSGRESFFDTVFANRWMIFVPLALLMIGGLLIWLRADRKKQAVPAPIEEKPAVMVEAAPPKNPLAQTEIMLVRNEPRQFYEILNKELHLFLAEKLHLSPEELNKKNIAEGLDRLGASLGHRIAVQQLLDDIALQLYTPFADENKMQEYYVEAVRLVGIFNG